MKDSPRRAEARSEVRVKEDAKPEPTYLPKLIITTKNQLARVTVRRNGKCQVLPHSNLRAVVERKVEKATEAQRALPPVRSWLSYYFEF